jgi:type IV pilus assembly protein PilM
MPLAVEEAAGIRSVLRRQGFSGSQVVIAANGEKLITGALELPARRDEVPMDQIARAEFARIQKCDLGAAEFDWWELPAPARGAKGTQVMAIAYPHSEAEAQMSIYEQAGFRVSAIEAPAAALARIGLRSAPGHATVAVLDLGWRAATLVLLRNGAVAYERRSPATGLAALHAALATRLRVEEPVVEEIMGEAGVSAEKNPAAVELASEARPVIVGHLNAVVEDVLKAMAYTSHRYPDAPVGILVLTGGGSCIPDLADHFGSALGIEVRTADPGRLSESEKGRGITSSHAAAAGLAAQWN